MIRLQTLCLGLKYSIDENLFIDFVPAEALFCVASGINWSNDRCDYVLLLFMNFLSADCSGSNLLL